MNVVEQTESATSSSRSENECPSHDVTKMRRDIHVVLLLFATRATVAGIVVSLITVLCYGRSTPQQDDYYNNNEDYDYDDAYEQQNEDTNDDGDVVLGWENVVYIVLFIIFVIVSIILLSRGVAEYIIEISRLAILCHHGVEVKLFDINRSTESIFSGRQRQNLYNYSARYQVAPDGPVYSFQRRRSYQPIPLEVAFVYPPYPNLLVAGVDEIDAPLHATANAIGYFAVLSLILQLSFRAMIGATHHHSIWIWTFVPTIFTWLFVLILFPWYCRSNPKAELIYSFIMNRDTVSKEDQTRTITTTTNNQATDSPTGSQTEYQLQQFV